MTWALITAGAGLLLLCAFSQHAWPRWKFWLALTQANAEKVQLNHPGEQAFQDDLRSLATRTSGQRGSTPSKAAEPSLVQSAERTGTLVS